MDYFLLKGPQEMSTGENSKGHNSFPGALENHTCVDSRLEDGVRGPTALAVSSDSDVESAEKVRGLGDHVLKVSKA